MLAAAQDEAARRGYLLLVVNVGLDAAAENSVTPLTCFTSNRFPASSMRACSTGT